MYIHDVCMYCDRYVIFPISIYTQYISTYSHKAIFVLARISPPKGIMTKIWDPFYK